MQYPHHSHSRPSRSCARLAAGLITAFAACAAHADHSGHSADREVRFTGPLVSSSPPLPKGLLNIEPYLINTQVRGYYDSDGHRQDVHDAAEGWHVAVPVMYGATDRLSLAATLNAGYSHDDFGTRRLAMGDTQVSASWLLHEGPGRHSPAFTLALKQNITSGHHDRLEQRRLAGATGSGASTTTVGLYGQAYFLPERTLRGRVNLGWRLPGAEAGIHGESAYGTEADFVGHARLGSAAVATAALEYSLSPNWVLASDVVYEQERSTRIRGQNGTGAGAMAVDERTPSSWRVSIAPAVEYHWSDQAGVIFGAVVSLDGRNSAAVVSPTVAVNLVF